MDPKIPKAFNSQQPGHLRLDGRCPICGTLYDFRKLKVLRELDGASLMYITCASCQGACVATMSLGPAGLSLVGMVTELTEPEVLSLLDEEPVSVDEIIELERILKEDKPVVANGSTSSNH